MFVFVGYFSQNFFHPAFRTFVKTVIFNFPFTLEK